tara:strand:+ start:4377 stop:5624 length:1248 start_codon:yes stop_codon:yes gene_type:complete
MDCKDTKKKPEEQIFLAFFLNFSSARWAELKIRFSFRPTISSLMWSSGFRLIFINMGETNKIFIYGLSGNDNIIRYVGKSVRPKVRRLEHLYEAKSGVSTHKSNWIRSLLDNGDDINVTILEEVEEVNWEGRERYWISKIPNLTNLSLGGDGGGTVKFTKPLDYVKLWVRNNTSVRTETEWRQFTKLNKLPNFIPKRPDSSYHNRGWVSWPDFFGINTTFVDYETLKKHVNHSKINSKSEYRKSYEHKKINSGLVPSNPDQYYSEWVSWWEFLNKEKSISSKSIALRFLPFSEAKKLIKSYKFTKVKDYTLWYLKNKNSQLPRVPRIYYYDEWVSWPDFFGNNLQRDIKYLGRKKSTHFLTCHEAKEWMNDNYPNVYTETKWRLLSKYLPNYIPKRPDYVYRNLGWVSWPDFLKP